MILFIRNVHRIAVYSQVSEGYLIMSKSMKLPTFDIQLGNKVQILFLEIKLESNTFKTGNYIHLARKLI